MCAEGREVDQSLNTCLPARLCNHPRTIHMDLAILEVPMDTGTHRGDGHAPLPLFAETEKHTHTHTHTHPPSLVVSADEVDDHI